MFEADIVPEFVTVLVSPKTPNDKPVVADAEIEPELVTVAVVEPRTE